MVPRQGVGIKPPPTSKRLVCASSRNTVSYGKEREVPHSLDSALGMDYVVLWEASLWLLYVLPIKVYLFRHLSPTPRQKSHV